METIQAPDHVAARLIEIVDETRRTRSQPANPVHRSRAIATTRIRNHFNETLRTALPPHLSSEEPPCDLALPAPVSLGLSAEEITWTFRVMLLRDPHPELETPRLLREVASVRQLRKILSETSEFAHINSTP